MYSLEDKKRWLNVYERNCFNISKTCIETTISHSVIYQWLNSDKEEKLIEIQEPCTFKKSIELIKDSMVGQAEGVLKNALNNNDTKVAMYITDTLGRDKYSRKTEVNNRVEIAPNDNGFYKALKEHIDKSEDDK